MQRRWLIKQNSSYWEPQADKACRIPWSLFVSVVYMYKGGYVYYFLLHFIIFLLFPYSLFLRAYIYILNGFFVKTKQCSSSHHSHYTDARTNFRCSSSFSSEKFVHAQKDRQLSYFTCAQKPEEAYSSGSPSETLTWRTWSTTSLSICITFIYTSSPVFFFFFFSHLACFILG